MSINLCSYTSISAFSFSMSIYIYSSDSLILSIYLSSSVSRVRWMHRLYLCRRVNPSPQRVSGYDTKPSYGKASGEYGVSLNDSQVHSDTGVVSVRLQSVSQIKPFYCVQSNNWYPIELFVFSFFYSLA